MQVKFKKLIRYVIIPVVCFVLSFCAIPITNKAKAQENSITFKETILKAVQEMEDVMERSYRDKEKELTTLSIIGYDYELSAESFYSNERPYINYDYARFIAAYTTIQHHILENNMDIKNGINEIEFVRMDYKEAYHNEYEIKEATKYVLNENGDYIPDGTYYITEPGLFHTYVLNSDYETYKRGKPVYVELEEKQTKYADITLRIITFEELYETFDLNREDFIDEEESRYQKIKNEIGEAKLDQNVLLITQSRGISAEDNLIIENARMIVGDNVARNTFINVAASIIGEVPYEWGGKSTKEGFDTSWYTFDENGKQKGLDCSGYAQWILRTSGYENWNQLVSTTDFIHSDLLEPISSYELMPGDFGLFYPNNEKINHMGMYLGCGYWIHCSSSANTVSIGQSEKFTIYRRLKNINELSLKQINFANDATYHVNENVLTPSHEELMLFAKIVQCESLGEGFNGWVAVAEVIKNRVFHEKFPNTITEVVEANKQFESLPKAHSLKDEDVNEDIISVCKEVCNGSLSILNNPTIIGFKRCDNSDVWNKWERVLDIGNHSFYSYTK